MLLCLAQKWWQKAKLLFPNRGEIEAETLPNTCSQKVGSDSSFSKPCFLLVRHFENPLAPPFPIPTYFIGPHSCAILVTSPAHLLVFLWPQGGLLPGNGMQCIIKTLISNLSPARLTWLLPSAAERVNHKTNIYCEMRRFPHMGNGPDSSSANLTPSDAPRMTISFSSKLF